MRLASNDLPGQNLEEDVIALALINWTLLQVIVGCAHCFGLRGAESFAEKSLFKERGVEISG
jgi:hypothetical protein